jgi:hypothetical protein
VRVLSTEGKLKGGNMTGNFVCFLMGVLVGLIIYEFKNWGKDLKE